MMGRNGSSRRSFVKLLAAVPLLSQIAARDAFAQASTVMRKGAKQNVYSRLGVKTIINCRGTWTYLSGSLEFPEVRQAQLEAAEYFVNIKISMKLIRRSVDFSGSRDIEGGWWHCLTMGRATAPTQPGTNRPC